MAIMTHELATVLNDAPKLYEKMQNTIQDVDMAKQAEKKAADPNEYVPKPPKQVQDQMAEAEAIRAEMDKDTAACRDRGRGCAPRKRIRGGRAADPAGGSDSFCTPPAEDGEQSWEQRFRSQQGRLEQAAQDQPGAD